VKTFVQCAEMFSPCNIYISGAQNIYVSAQISIYLLGNILACAGIFSLPTEIYSLRAENYMLRGNFFKLRGHFLFARGNYYVLTILGMPECRD
jgi:hypothetical protein